MQVTNQEHGRNGQAGSVFATNAAKPDVVAVKFDIDGTVEEVSTSDLKGL